MGGLSLMFCILMMNFDGGFRGRLEVRFTVWVSSTYCVFFFRFRFFVI